MAKIGYARASTVGQSTETQVQALTAAGCEFVREEKASGTNTAGRPVLLTILDLLRKGDVLVVTKIDRLARSISDLQIIIGTIKERQATLQCIDQPVDTSTAAGKCFLDMLGVFAEFETNLRKERQMEGIAAAKAKGVYKGRKTEIDTDEVRRLVSEGESAINIAKSLNISRASVYRVLGTKS